MTKQQKTFAAFLAEGNRSAAQCARDAGFSSKCAKQLGCKLRKHPGVMLELARIRAGAPNLVEHLTDKSDPVGYLRAVMADPYVEPRRRLRAARALLRLER